MPADIDVVIGADTGPFQNGMASLRNTVRSTSNELGSILTGAFTVTGIVAALSSVVEKMHNIHHEAERFGLDAEALQRISVPAQMAGVAMETVARAMNFVQLAGVKAAQGGEKMVGA